MTNPPSDDLLIVIPGKPARSELAQHLDAEILLAYLRQAGFRASIVDQALSSLDPPALGRRLARSPDQTILWHLPTRHEFHALLRIAKVLESRDSTGETAAKGIWLAGGHFASHHDAQVLNSLPGLDAIVRGEQELPVEAVCRALRDGLPWHTNPGITFRTTGKPVRNPLGKDLLDPERLPPAADDLFDPRRHEVGQKILFNRGCNSDCQYCGFQVLFRDRFPRRKIFWRSRRAQSIVDEIELYVHRYGVSRFVFCAGVFFGYDAAGTEVVRQVAEETLSRDLRIRFSFVTHPQHLVRNRLLLPLLDRAGLDTVVLGVDSGSEAALRRFRVEFTQNQILDAFEILHTHRLTFTPAFIFYDPYMDLEEVEQQLSFLRRVAPYFAHMEASYPWFLDHYLLHTKLKVSSMLPMAKALTTDDLIPEATVPGKTREARFRDPAVARFQHIHQAAQHLHLRKLRSLLWKRSCVDRNPQLNLLPIDLLEHLLEATRADPHLDIEGAMERAEKWLDTALEAALPGVKAVADLPTS